MAISYTDFLNRLIDEGIEAARKDYGPGKKLEGSIAGFEACRGLDPDGIRELLEVSRRKTGEARMRRDEGEFWQIACFELEVEWVANCVSAILVNEGRKPLLNYFPTIRGMLKAAEIAGVSV